MTTELQGTESGAAAGGPGAQLKKQRLAVNRSLEDVAHEMHMNVWQVEALEEETYEKLGGSVFVQGYIRSYSRLLEIDAAPLLKAFSDQNIQEPRWEMHPPVEEAAGKNIWLPVFTALVSAALVAAFVVWLNANGYFGTAFGFKPSNDVTEDVQDDAPAEAPVLLENSEGGSSQQLQLPGFPLESLVEEEAPIGSVTEGEGVQENIPEPSDDAQVLVEKAEDEATVTAAEKQEEGAAQESAVKEVTAENEPAGNKERQEPSAAPAPAPQRTASEGNDIQSGAGVVSLSFEEDSWVEVRDANDKLLIHGLRKAGFAAQIDGKAPYQVFLGNAPGVSIEINGDVFDTQPFVRDNRTARFLLLQE